jgi:hypothetical protein
VKPTRIMSPPGMCFLGRVLTRAQPYALIAGRPKKKGCRPHPASLFHFKNSALRGK